MGEISITIGRELQKKKREEEAAGKQAAGKQAMGNKGRGKVGITFTHPLVHRDDDTRSSGNDSSEAEIFSTPSDPGSKKRRIQSTPR